MGALSMLTTGDRIVLAVRTNRLSDTAPEIQRVIEALHDHTLLPVIAAAAELSEERARAILDDLVSRHIAERYTEELWGLKT